MTLVQSYFATVAAGLVLLGPAGAQAPVKPKPEPRFASKVAELTDKASANWLLSEAKAGAKLWSGRDYAVVKLPAEVRGGTLILREIGEDSDWLAPGTIRTLKDSTVYVLVRWKALGKDVLEEVAFAKLEKEGWAEVPGDVETTFPSGEDWRWKAYKKKVEKGEVTLQLKKLNWKCSAVFVVQ